MAPSVPINPPLVKRGSLEHRRTPVEMHAYAVYCIGHQEAINQ
ncbi:hypothetical protein CCACVL1_23759 [Corchorus capsularis]|uniref:Uncharacterized protein n=1 Tax=Corchorus capsularis TaxID=210143 RepID=A0A1R3GSI1_COCAP|nr:hypothetical protein CCACVL1_23759 [Corchorus capsularis]